MPPSLLSRCVWQPGPSCEIEQVHPQAFLALGTGVLLLNLIPQFQYILENEIGSTNQSANLPKLFLFDIQDEQLNELCVTLESEGKPLKNLTPWVRGKLLEVKGKEI